jgi:hypothetical protein
MRKRRRGRRRRTRRMWRRDREIEFCSEVPWVTVPSPF